MELWSGDDFHCFCTAVYASPVETVRNELWNRLSDLATSISDPWLLSGDFNVYKSLDEKWGGSRVLSVKCTRFDPGFIGTKYTWQRGRVRERLDIALCNST